MKKICSQCEIPKDINNFHREKRQKDGHRPECKKCRKDKYIAKQEKLKPVITAITERANKSSKKIKCNRTKTMISISACIPGCNDLCIPCENKQINNISAGGDTLTREEEAIARHEGILSLNYTEMIEPYAER